MLIDSYSEVDTELWIAADLVGASLIFRNSRTCRVTVHRNGYLIGETCERRNSHEWAELLKGL